MRTVTVAALVLLLACSAVSAFERPGAIDLGGAWRMNDLTRGVGVVVRPQGRNLP